MSHVGANGVTLIIVNLNQNEFFIKMTVKLNLIDKTWYVFKHKDYHYFGMHHTVQRKDTISKGK